MKKTVSLFLIFTILCSFSGHSQDYYKGYIISNDSDSLVGYIEEFDFYHKLKTISFKYEKDGEILSFLPEDIKEFGLKGLVYIGAEVKSLSSIQNNFELVSKDKVQYVTEWAFLNVLVNGNKKLFYYRNQYGNTNFYIDYNGEILLLEHAKYIEEKEGKEFKIENNKFQGQLKFYLNNCEKLNTKIDKLSYDKAPIVNIFRQYSKCVSDDLSFVTENASIKPEIKSKTAGRFQFSLLTGLLTSFSAHNSNSQPYFRDAGNHYSLGYTIAVRFEFFPDKTKRNFSINAELNTSSSKFTGNYTMIDKENQKSISDWNLNFNRTKLNILPSYRFNFNKFSLFVNAGISIGTSNATSSIDSKTIIYVEDETYEYPSHGEIINSNLMELSFMAGVGIQYWNVFLEFRMDSQNNIDVNGFSANFYGIHSFLGYRF